MYVIHIVPSPNGLANFFSVSDGWPVPLTWPELLDISQRPKINA